MGQNTSTTVATIVIPDRTILYYGSAKFKELQIDRGMMGMPFAEFPSEKNFFLTTDLEISLGAYTRHKPDAYYRNSPRHIGENKDSIHVYETVGEQKMVDITDPETINYILFVDENSPFHVSKQDKSYYDAIDMFEFKGDEAVKMEYEARLGMPINPLSGFGLVVASTNYHNHELFSQDLQRTSVYDVDYVISDLLSKYLKDTDIRGWAQSDDGHFHQEYMFFYPQESLEPVYNHPHSWFNYLNKGKTDIFLLVKKVQEELDELIVDEFNLKQNIRANERMLSEPNREILEETFKGDIYKYRDALRKHILDEKYELEEVREGISRKIADNISPYLKKFNESATIQEYYFKSRNLCKIYQCKLPFTFENCQEGVEKLLQEMEKYPLKTTIHHVGKTVGDHSVWVARTIYNWFAYKNSPWTKDIWEELRNITLMAAFTHDIGKIGDLDYQSLIANGAKPDHPFKGYEYFLNNLQFKYVNDDRIHHDVLTRYIGCTYRKQDVIISAVIAGMHHYLGQLLMSVEVITPTSVDWDDYGPNNFPFSFNPSRYLIPKPWTKLGKILDMELSQEFKYMIFLHKMLGYLNEADRECIFYNNKDNLRQLLHILFAVSAADTYGSYPVKISRDNSVFEPYTSKILDPEVLFTQTSSAKVIEIMRPYYRFMYHSYGLIEMEKFFNFFEDIVDIDTFFQAWNEYDRFTLYVNSVNDNPETVGPIPNLPKIYSQLGETLGFKENLINLLRRGIINNSNESVKSLSEHTISFLNSISGPMTPSAPSGDYSPTYAPPFGAAQPFGAVPPLGGAVPLFGDMQPFGAAPAYTPLTGASYTPLTGASYTPLTGASYTPNYVPLTGISSPSYSPPSGTYSPPAGSGADYEMDVDLF